MSGNHELPTRVCKVKTPSSEDETQICKTLKRSSGSFFGLETLLSVGMGENKRETMGVNTQTNLIRKQTKINKNQLFEIKSIQLQILEERIFKSYFGMCEQRVKQKLNHVN